MFTQVNLIGHLVDVPEVRKAGEKKLVTLRVATNYYEQDEEKPMFHNVSFWLNSVIERVEANKYNKGDLVFISGKLKPSTYKRKDGSSVETYEVIGSSLIKLTTKANI